LLSYFRCCKIDLSIVARFWHKMSTITSSISKNGRCNHGDCMAKVGLAAVACKCGSMFCSSHKHCELHNCSYDFYGVSKSELTKKLIKVVGNTLSDRL